MNTTTMRRYRLIFAFLFLVLFTRCSPSIEHAYVSFDVTSDGETMVYADAHGDLWLYAFANHELTRLTESEATEASPSFSPDGTSIVFAKENAEGHGTSVYLMTIETRELRQITNPDQYSDSDPVFSPDGTTIAFKRAHLLRRYSTGGWTWGRWDVYTVALDGSTPERQSYREYYSIGGLAFSSDASRIYFTSDESGEDYGGRRTLYTMALADGSITETPPGSGGDGAWISDTYTNSKGEMVFISDRASAYNYDVFFQGLDGEQKPLGVTAFSGYNQNPVLTNTGVVLFLAQMDWDSDHRPILNLWSVNTDGTSAKQLADYDLFANPTQWSYRSHAGE